MNTKFHKGCEWWYGRSGTPDITLCKLCVRKWVCKGRKLILKIKQGKAKTKGGKL